MADTKISELAISNPVATPAATDLHEVTQGGASKAETNLQILNSLNAVGIFFNEGDGTAGFANGSIAFFPDGGASFAGADVEITSAQLSAGVIATASLNNSGADYVINDVLSVVGGDNNASITVDSVDGGGAILAFTISFGGTGYSAGGPYAVTGGSGVDAEINVDSIVPSVPANLSINGTINSVKVYRALLTQSGTNSPVATVLENTLGGTPVWARDSQGAYTLTLTDAFPVDKTMIFLGSPEIDFGSNFDSWSQSNGSRPNTIFIFIRRLILTLAPDLSYEGVDGGLTATPIQILVYP